MSNHWYDDNGKPQYTIKGTNGKLRDTSLRDARKYNWGVGTTTVIDIPEKPQLIEWKQNQLLEAILELGSLPTAYEEEINEWKEVVIERSKHISKSTSDHGKKIHSALETYFIFKTMDEEHKDFIVPVIQKVESMFPGKLHTFVPEETFYHPLGFGGSVDLYSEELNVILDFKNKNKGAAEWDKVDAYENQSQQIAAYRAGLSVSKPAMKDAVGYNIFISILEPGLVKEVKWESSELDRSWEMFQHLLKYWQLKNNYIPNKERTYAQQKH